VIIPFYKKSPFGLHGRTRQGIHPSDNQAGGFAVGVRINGDNPVWKDIPDRLDDVREFHKKFPQKPVSSLNGSEQCKNLAIAL
jgi:hypothetical protein